MPREDFDADEMYEQSRIVTGLTKEEYFMHHDWDGAMLKMLGYEHWSDETANELAIIFSKWKNNTYHVTDNVLIMMFEEIQESIDDYLSDLGDNDK